MDNQLPKAALATQLVDREGDTITLKEVSKQNNIKVIDFWASWCAPCINEIKTTKAFKNKLRIENDVEWIYLSVDEDPESWLKKSKELSPFIQSKYQYHIVKGVQSALAKHLKVRVSLAMWCLVLKIK